MSLSFAGRYGPEPVVNARGDALDGALVNVYESDGVSLATLYDGKLKASTVANPVTVGGDGNLSFWAVPGDYVVETVWRGRSVGRESVTVGAHPGDLDVVPLTANQNETVSGSWDFTGGISENGTALSATYVAADIPFINAAHPDYGAVGDGVTDDAAAIQAALDAAKAVLATDATLVTHMVYLPPGHYRVGAQLVVPNKVQLVGAGRDVTKVDALGSFPTATAVVRLGEAGDSNTFNCRVAHLQIDCNGVTNSDGIYSDSVNEKSGALDVTIVQCRRYGIHIEDTASGTPQQCVFRDVEVLFQATSALSGARGVFVESASTGYSFQNMTVIGSLTNAYIDACFYLVGGASCHLSNIHVEGATYGVQLGDATDGAAPSTTIEFLTGPTGFASMTTLLHVEHDSTQNWMAAGLRRGLATNSINDTVLTRTITNEGVGLYAVGRGTTARRPVITTDSDAATRMAEVKMADRLSFRSVQTFGDGDTTPSVAEGNFFHVSNTGATTISQLDDGESGQLVVMRFLNNTTTVQDASAGGSFQLAGDASWNPNLNDTLTVIHHGGVWYEVARSAN